MGVLKKLVIITLIYGIIGFVWSVLIRLGHIPPPEGLLSYIYTIFAPVTALYYLIVAWYTTNIPD